METHINEKSRRGGAAGRTHEGEELIGECTGSRAGLFIHPLSNLLCTLMVLLGSAAAFSSAHRARAGIITHRVHTHIHNSLSHHHREGG